jgi:hypothetical protein
MVAGTAASDFIDPAIEPLNIAVPRHPLDDRVEEVGDPSQSELARSALARRLAREVSDHPSALAQAAVALAKRDYYPRPEACADPD